MRRVAAVLALLLCASACAEISTQLRREYRPPGPPGAQVEPACPAYADLESWKEDHPGGSLDANANVTMVLWCSEEFEDPGAYVQLETTDAEAAAALRLPSYRDPGVVYGCDQRGSVYYWSFIAVTDRGTAMHVLPPAMDCGLPTPEFQNALAPVTWTRSAVQPG